MNNINKQSNQKIKVHLYFRSPEVGPSIHRVFRTLISDLEKEVDFRIFTMPRKGSLPWDVWVNCRYVWKTRCPGAIHHVTGHIHDILMALFGTKTILTVHDLVFLDNVKDPFKRFYKWLFWLFIPMKIADKVVCISDQTCLNISSKIKTNKLSVISNAVDPIFTFTKKTFNREKPVILHIGTGWNKNLTRTIQALQGINCHIRIIGRLKEDQIQLLDKLQIEYSNSFDLSDIEIKDEYLNCDIVNFPSLYEGFGMPVIEGQMTGRVVITSMLEPMMTVSNGGAVMVNPEKIESIREAYIKVIEDENFRNNLIEKGIKNATRFKIEEVSKQYLSLYQILSDQ